MLRVRRATSEPVPATRRRATPALAAVGFLVGLVATSAGLGVGVGHLVKHDAGVDMVAGLLLLGAGLVLLLGSSARLVTACRGWWRVGVALGLLVLAVLVVTPSWVAFYATRPGRPALGSATPADRGLAYTDVVVRATDGVRLAGWYIPSRNRAAVVLRHGAGSTRTAVLGQASVLARAGYGVLLTDARGHGESAGRGMDLGWYGDQDVSGAVDFLAHRPDVDPSRIGVVGVSMGGEEAIGAAAGDPRIHAVVAEGATGRSAADMAWLSGEYGVRGALTRAWYWLLTERLTDLMTAAAPPISLHDAVARAAPTRVLLIAAGDVADEPPAAHYIRSAAPASVEVWVVPGSGHIRGLATRPGAWRAHVLGFLDGALRPVAPAH